MDAYFGKLKSDTVKYLRNFKKAVALSTFLFATMCGNDKAEMPASQTNQIVEEVDVPSNVPKINIDSLECKVDNDDTAFGNSYWTECLLQFSSAGQVKDAYARIYVNNVKLDSENSSKPKIEIPSITIEPGQNKKLELADYFEEGKYTVDAEVGFKPYQDVLVSTKKTMKFSVPFIDYKALEDDDPFIGDKDAPLTIIGFLDFDPDSVEFMLDTFPDIERNYLKTGKAKFVFRDFPDYYRNSEIAAEAVECADEQNRFRDMQNKIFDVIDNVVVSNSNASLHDFNDIKEVDIENLLEAANLKNYAAEIGLNTQQFNDCLDSRRYKPEVEKDFDDGESVRVFMTPTLFIGEEREVGDTEFDELEDDIEDELDRIEKEKKQEIRAFRIISRY